jgi:hypothetical protein
MLKTLSYAPDSRCGLPVELLNGKSSRKVLGLLINDLEFSNQLRGPGNIRLWQFHKSGASQ